MKRHAPATERNREPIAAILDEVLPARGTVLEVASGSGEHSIYFARRFPHLTWLPSDVEPSALASIRARVAEAALPNLCLPLSLDASSDEWPVARADAMLAINMIHISPWRACAGLMAGAGRVLPPGGLLYIYGPYRISGRPTAPSNESFDDSLRARNPAWGLRYVHEVEAAADAHGLTLFDMRDMPCNNTSLLFGRRAE